MPQIQLEKPDEPPNRYACNGVQRDGNILIVENPKTKDQKAQTWFLPIDDYELIRVYR